MAIARVSQSPGTEKGTLTLKFVAREPGNKGTKGYILDITQGDASLKSPTLDNCYIMSVCD